MWDAEALIVRPDISTIGDLNGKTIAAPSVALSLVGFWGWSNAWRRSGFFFRLFLVLAIALSLACGVICGTGPEALLNPSHD